MRRLLTPVLAALAVFASAVLCRPLGRCRQVPADLGVASKTGLVVSSSDIASDLGAEVLARGGNAVDAAVATAFAMAVTYPTAGNIGGGGFMIVRTPDGQADGVRLSRGRAWKGDADDVSRPGREHRSVA